MQQGDEQRSDNLDEGDEERPRMLVVLTGADTWTLADGTSHSRSIESSMRAARAL